MIFFKREDEAQIEDDIGYVHVMKKAWQFLSLPKVKQLCFLLLTVRLTFAATDFVIPLVLLEKGFPEADLAMFSIIKLPLDMSLAVLIGVFAKTGNELQFF